jgi:hypothetical protein
MANIFPTPDNNITGIMGLFQYVNTLTKGDSETGLLGIMILIMVGFVTFLSTKGYSVDRAFGYTGFLLLIVAILLRFLNLINDAVMIIVFVLFIGSLIFLIRERNSEEGAV